MVTVHATINKKQINVKWWQFMQPSTRSRSMVNGDSSCNCQQEADQWYIHRDSSCNRKMVTIHATVDMNQISFHATMSVHSTGNDDQFSIKRWQFMQLSTQSSWVKKSDSSCSCQQESELTGDSSCNCQQDALNVKTLQFIHQNQIFKLSICHTLTSQTDKSGSILDVYVEISKQNRKQI